MRATDGSLVFVEVRYRASQSRGGALASIDQHKQERLIQAARHYLATHGSVASVPCRFDVVAIAPADGREPHVEWIPNAFLAE